MLLDIDVVIVRRFAEASVAANVVTDAVVGGDSVRHALVVCVYPRLLPLEQLLACFSDWLQDCFQPVPDRPLTICTDYTLVN